MGRVETYNSPWSKNDEGSLYCTIQEKSKIELYEKLMGKFLSM